MRRLILGLLVVCAVAAEGTFYQGANTPVIGVYTMPANQSLYRSKQFDLIQGAYVSWLEQAGARVVPVPYAATQDELRQIFAQVNGLLFTGGMLDLNVRVPVSGTPYGYNIYTKNAQYLIGLAVEANIKGDYFPVWGTCQGIELMLYIANGLDLSILQRLENNQNVTRSGHLFANSTLLRGLSDGLQHYLQHEQPLFYYNELATYPEKFHASQASKFYGITGLSKNGSSAQAGAVSYIAAIEAKDYPFFGVQFHPEIQQFNFHFHSDKSREAFQISQHLAQTFVDLCKKSTHRYASAQELQLSLVNNVSPLWRENRLVYIFEKRYYPHAHLEKLLLNHELHDSTRSK